MAIQVRATTHTKDGILAKNRPKKVNLKSIREKIAVPWSPINIARVNEGVVRIVKDLDQEIEGRNVLIVEDIIDTGHTLKYLLRTLAVRKPKTLNLASLLIKDDVERPHFDIQYEGFHIPNEFVVGYGLDYNEQYRNLPYVGVMDTDSTSSPTDVQEGFKLAD